MNATLSECCYDKSVHFGTSALDLECNTQTVNCPTLSTLSNVSNLELLWKKGTRLLERPIVWRTCPDSSELLFIPGRTSCENMYVSKQLAVSQTRMERTTMGFAVCMPWVATHLQNTFGANSMALLSKKS